MQNHSPITCVWRMEYPGLKNIGLLIVRRLMHSHCLWMGRKGVLLTRPSTLRGRRLRNLLDEMAFDNK